MVVSEIKLYELLKARIGESEAEAFIQILEKDATGKSVEKAGGVREESVSKIFHNVLKAISDAKSDIVKWRITTSAAVVGLIVAILKLT